MRVNDFFEMLQDLSDYECSIQHNERMEGMVGWYGFVLKSVVLLNGRPYEIEVDTTRMQANERDATLNAFMEMMSAPENIGEKVRKSTMDIYTMQERHRGFHIVVKLRGSFRDPEAAGHWFCGYVRVPDEHKFYGLNDEELNEHLCVHGGVTFSGELDGFEGFYVGFDCGHCGDSPMVEDEEYTIEECKSLVDQLIEVGDSI